MASGPPPSRESVARPPEVVIDSMRARGSALVALSGGVDSAVVASLAHAALGGKALAVTLVGPAVSAAETARAAAVAHQVGIAHTWASVDPLVDEQYRINPANRCYFCRRAETGVLLRVGAARSIEQYLDGLHLDDLGDDRPGIRAMDQAGFLHPLIEAGWRKSDVRAYARNVGLPNWDQPSDACLASRVAHGQVISAELLRRVELAEQWLAERGFRRVRVRVSGDSARVEVAPEEVERLRADALSLRLGDRLRELGFPRFSVDPAGYRPRPGA
jgi:uncharacterized protein